MDQSNIQEELDLTHENNINSVEQQTVFNEQASDIGSDNTHKEAFGENIEPNQQVAINNQTDMDSALNEAKKIGNVTQAYNGRPNQPNQNGLNYNQISYLERQMLLNNNNSFNSKTLSNWTKVMLTSLSVLLPGIGQIVGIILGLVFVANDRDADRRSFGAALITVSVIAFIIAAIFWFIFALSFGPDLYYY